VRCDVGGPLVCRLVYGCGVGAPMKRQVANTSDADAEINGAKSIILVWGEGIQLSRIGFGLWDTGDTANITILNAYPQVCNTRARACNDAHAFRRHPTTHN
jgi:hypothetical protein